MIMDWLMSILAVIILVVIVAIEIFLRYYK